MPELGFLLRHVSGTWVVLYVCNVCGVRYLLSSPDACGAHRGSDISAEYFTNITDIHPIAAVPYLVQLSEELTLDIGTFATIATLTSNEEE